MRSIFKRQAEPAFRCPGCGRVTHHPEDVRYRYCPCCGNAELPKDCPHADAMRALRNR